MVKLNVEPLPTSLSTHIRPPMSSASRLLMARPRPVPPKRRVVEASTWLKDWKSRPMPAGGMPMPVSFTLKTISAVSPSTDCGRTVSSTSPRSVNFRALPRRLTSTCRNRDGSPHRPAGEPSATS